MMGSTLSDCREEVQHSRLTTYLGSWVICAVIIGCGTDNPFKQVQVKGEVSYADGILIPGEYVELEFIPQTPPKDVRTHARPGRAVVDPATGKFDTVTSHKYGDGVAVGRHKVLVHSLDANRRPTGAVPARYQNVETTPLEVDTADSPFVLKVEKKK
jgi:hypothetical protein